MVGWCAWQAEHPVLAPCRPCCTPACVAGLVGSVAGGCCWSCGAATSRSRSGRRWRRAAWCRAGRVLTAVGTNLASGLRARTAHPRPAPHPIRRAPHVCLPPAPRLPVPVARAVAGIVVVVLRYLTAGESHGRALVVIVEGLPAGLPVDGRRHRPRAGPAPARLRPWAPHALRAGRGHDRGRRPPRPHARFAGARSRSPTPSGPVPTSGTRRWRWSRAAPGRRSPNRGRATPTWRACRSTASATHATCSSGPRPARRRPGWRPGRSAKNLLGHLGAQVLSHVDPDGRRRGPRPPSDRRPPTSTGWTPRRCAASTSPPRRR